MSHFRRRFYDIAKGGNAPVATEVLARIGKLKPWLEQQLGCVSGRSSIAEAIRYGLRHWEGLIRFLDDGCIEIDTNTVERSIRPLALRA